MSACMGAIVCACVLIFCVEPRAPHTARHPLLRKQKVFVNRAPPHGSSPLRQKITATAIKSNMHSSHRCAATQLAIAIAFNG